MKIKENKRLVQLGKEAAKTAKCKVLIPKASPQKITINIKLTKTDLKFLNKIKFKNYDKDCSGFILIGNGISNEKLADRMVDIGIFQYIVSSWGYQEHEYALTDVGFQIINLLKIKL